MKIIISDCHIGTTMWQKAMLEKLGHNVIVKTLSNHSMYLNDAKKDPFFENIKNCHEDTIIKEFSEKYSDVTHILCSFPPIRIEDFKNIPSNIKIILNIGHRIHINVKSSEYDFFTNKLIEYSKNDRYILATMSEYDYQYVKYYCNLDLKKLYVACMHIPIKLNYIPKSNIILIGPIHNTHKLLYFNNLEDINKKSVLYSQKYNKVPYLFNFIKNIYPNTNFEDLVNHPAVLIFPYSAYSISMIELYQLNIPLICPSNKLLLGNMNDVKLYPLYNNNIDSIVNFDKKYKKNIPSPNSLDKNDELYWSKYMYFNQVENILRYNNNEELFEIVYNTDFCNVNNRMISENLLHINKEVNKWNELL
jgi:hypothetical protein